MLTLCGCFTNITTRAHLFIGRWLWLISASAEVARADKLQAAPI